MKNVYVAASEALRKTWKERLKLSLLPKLMVSEKERKVETQFTTKIDGFRKGKKG